MVGGGIAGLSAAWRASQQRGVSVTVFEPGRLGGKLATSDVAGLAVEEGPDAFLRRVPEAVRLCEELGLAQLVSPAAGRSLLWAGGRMRPLPEGLVLGVPGKLGSIIRSGLLSPTGIARAGLDLVLPPAHLGSDVSVGDLIGGRFGAQVATRLVEPLLGGIHAARLDQLSASVVAPQILAAARSGRSLLLALRRAAPPPAARRAPPAPVFARPAEGMAGMVARLGAALDRRGVSFRDQRVVAIGAAEPAAAPIPVTVQPDGGAAEEFHAVVLAVPSFEAARLLGAAAPDGLGSISFTTVAVLTVAVPPRQWSAPAGFNGFLVPPGDGRLTTAGSFYTNKWPPSDRRQAGTDGGPQVLRISAGRSDDQRISALGDDALTDALVAELSEVAGRRLEPTETRLSRWPDALPLYRVGHGELVGRIEADLAGRAPRVALAGASYRGAGIPACVRSGTEAADRVLALPA